MIETAPEVEQGSGSGSLRDPNTFRAFYRAALPRVYGYLLARCGGDVAVAEDLTQETFLAAVADVRRGVTPAAPVPWVIGIARHKLLDHYRRQARGQAMVALLAGAIGGRVPTDRWLLAEHDRDAPRERTMAALVALPAAQRAALVLRHVDGLPVPEVAALLGRSVHAVESLLARGRVGFKRHYLALGDEEGNDGS